MRWLFCGLSLGLVACQGGVSSTDPLPPDPNTPNPTPPTGDDRGAVWYGMQCASCHGALGEGGTAPALNAWTKPRDILVAVIDERMPLGNPDLCRGDCAQRVADYILEELQGPLPECEGGVPSLRRLRLLTRREYRQTVADLLHAPAPVCMALGDCRLETQSCEAGLCVNDRCELHTFVLDLNDRTPAQVVVAGTFNGWAPTAAQGAWPMQRLPGTQRWYAKHALPNGQHDYKFVLDGQEWRADPNNPTTVPDGQGGVNSRLTQSCGVEEPANPAADPTLHFPVESRPAGYFFDAHAASGVVTPVHADEYLGAARVFAEQVATRPALYDCHDQACDQRFIRDFGARAFRRPLSDVEVQRYVALIGADRAAGIRTAIEVLLSSPNFLYRSELGTADGDLFRLDDWELASALSYQLWGTMPDEALLDAAAAGQLSTPEGRRAQAERLLADPRAARHLGDFAIDWLGLGGVIDQPKRGELFPEVTPALRAAMLQETRRLFADVALGGGGYAQLLQADYGYVDEALARLYQLPGTYGAELTRANKPPLRAGILGQASVLFAYAHSDQGSPIKRGVFVRERLLCQKFGVPPPEAGGLPEVDPNATTRERFQMHSSKPSCNACHQYIDGVGFGFERFDAIGRARDQENGRPIDDRGEIVDLEAFGRGTRAEFSSLSELGAAMAQSQAGPDCMATQYYRFVQGEAEGETDRCLLQPFLNRYRSAGGDLRGLILDLIADEGYALRRGEP